MANLSFKSQTQQTNTVGLDLGLGISSTDQGGKHLGIPQGLTNPSDNGMKFDAFSIRITLVIVFCIIFLVAILIIFIVICLKRNKCINRSRNQNSRTSHGKSNRYGYHDGSTSRPVSNGSDNSFMNENEDYLHEINYSGSTPMNKDSKKSFELRPHQPDIIEAEIHFVPSYHVYDYAYDHRMYGHTTEHSNLPVQCTKSGAPDLNCYRTLNQSVLQSPVSYQEHQEAKRRYFAHRSVGQPPQTVFSRVSSPEDSSLPASGNDKGEYLQNTPLARLTPSTSSESPLQPVRILTLQDISRKQLQSIISESTSSSGEVSKEMVHSSSDMSWNSPIVSQLNKWNLAPKIPMDNCNLRDPTSIEIEDLNPLDMVVDERPPPGEHSSSSESDDDSFTGSEFGEDNENKDAVALHQTSNGGHSLGVQPLQSASTICGESADTFSSIVNCDDLTAHNLSSSLQSFDNLLNCGINFESLVDVFQDLADLPDFELGRPNNTESTSALSEIYV